VPDSASSTYTNTNIFANSSSPPTRNALKAKEILNESGTVKARTEIIYDSYSTTANATSTKTWDSAKAALNSADSNGLRLDQNNSLTSAAEYDSFGNATLLTDANGNQTQVTYGSINGYTGLYPTQTVSAYQTSIAQTTQAAYDFYTGAQTSVTVLGNTSGENVTTTTTYDDLGRPIKVAAAYGTANEVWTQTEYDDANRRVTVKSVSTGVKN
jgi:hypothetical protein